MRVGKVVLGLVASGVIWAAAVRAEEPAGVAWQSDMGVRQTSALLGTVQDGSPVASEKAEEKPPAGEWHKPAPKTVKPRIVHPKAVDSETPGATKEASPAGKAKSSAESKPRVLPGLPTPSAKPGLATPSAKRPDAAPGDPLPPDPAYPPPKQAGRASPSHEEKPAAAAGIAGAAGCGPACGSCGDDACNGSCSGHKSGPCEDDAWRLVSSDRLDAARIRLRGWIDQGITWNPDRPGNRFNGPVIFNDRANEYQMNQAYLVAERKIANDGFGFDWGGRADLLYGTDSRFLVANGLETNWNEGQRFYGAALPQLYADLAYDDLTVRIGHFYNIMGYESPMAPENFFYSHSYAMQYGQPLTFTGILGMFKINDCWSASAGVHRGWNQWNDANGKAGFLFGVTWTSPDEDTQVNFAVTLSNEQMDRPSRLSDCSLVVRHDFTPRVHYVFQYTGGTETDAVPRRIGFDDAEWFGIANYLFYDLNPCWSVGLRYEWFGDYDGTRVTGLGAPKGFAWDGIASHWDELALGVNYRPNPNVTLRSELRFDWADPMVDTQLKAFDDYTKNHQFLWATDLIVKF